MQKRTKSNVKKLQGINPKVGVDFPSSNEDNFSRKSYNLICLDTNWSLMFLEKSLSSE